MRDRRTSTTLTVALTAALFPVIIWLAGAAVSSSAPAAADQDAFVLGPEMPALSTEADPAEGQLLTTAHHQAEAQRAAAAAAARHARLEQLARQRAARDAARAQPAAAAQPAPHPAGDDVWARLRQCESGGRYDINTGNGYYGAYQFLLSTWRGLGYPGYPHQAPPAVQDEAARKLQARSGWGQWPACSRRLGLR